MNIEIEGGGGELKNRYIYLLKKLIQRLLKKQKRKRPAENRLPTKTIDSCPKPPPPDR